MCPPTDRQLKRIADMEQLLDIKFTGKTVREASLFISQNMRKYKEEKEILFDLVYNENNY